MKMTMTKIHQAQVWRHELLTFHRRIIFVDVLLLHYFTSQFSLVTGVKAVNAHL